MLNETFSVIFKHRVHALSALIRLSCVSCRKIFTLNKSFVAVVRFYAVEGVEDVSRTQPKGVEIVRSLWVDAKIN